MERTFSTHAEIDSLNDIHKRLVLSVSHVRFAPGERAGRLHHNLARVFGARLGLDAFCRDVHLERVGLGVLGVAEVDNLCGSSAREHNHSEDNQ